MTHHDEGREAVPTVAGPFDHTGWSKDRRAWANAQLRRMEELVELMFEAGASVRAVARLLGRGFNLMRHEVRVSDVGAATTRFVG